MQRLEVLENPTPATPEPANVTAAKEEAPTLREPAQQTQPSRVGASGRPAVVAALSQVGEPIYERFKHQKLPVFDDSPNPTEAVD